jgi:CheY-like chemotaxis protein
MDGFQLCKTVKNDPRLSSIPFIIYSSDYIDEEDKDLAKTIGADRYVVKTGGTDSLILAVSELLNISEPKTVFDPNQQSLPLDDRSFLERHYKLLIKKLEEKLIHKNQVIAELMEENIKAKKANGDL